VAEILSLVWGIPANFNGFRVLASLLQHRRSTEVNQTLHYVWPSPGLVHYIYTFGISCLLTEFCDVHNTLSVHLRTIAQVSRAISSQLRHLSTIGKKLAKQQYILQMSPQYGELWPTSGSDRLVVWAPLQISMGFTSWQRYCTVFEQWAPAKLCGIEQRAPPIIGRAAITLGIGPHSSYGRPM